MLLSWTLGLHFVYLIFILKIVRHLTLKPFTWDAWGLTHFWMVKCMGFFLFVCFDFLKYIFFFFRDTQSQETTIRESCGTFLACRSNSNDKGLRFHWCCFLRVYKCYIICTTFHYWPMWFNEEQRTMMMLYFWLSYLIIPCDASPVERKLVLLHPVYWLSQSHCWAACVAWGFAWLPNHCPFPTKPEFCQVTFYSQPSIYIRAEFWKTWNSNINVL